MSEHESDNEEYHFDDDDIEIDENLSMGENQEEDLRNQDNEEDNFQEIENQENNLQEDNAQGGNEIVSDNIYDNEENDEEDYQNLDANDLDAEAVDYENIIDDMGEGELYDDNYQSKASKKLRRKGKKKKKEVEIEDLNEQEIANQSNLITKKKRKKNQMTDEELSEKVEQIRTNMEQAYLNDIERMKKEQPAFEKLKMVTDLTNELKSQLIQLEFLKQNGLNSLLQWLTNYSDGTKPSDQLKLKVLTLIETLYVSKEDLEKAQKLCKKIKFFKESQHESKEIKLLSKKIFEKWYRIISNNIIDYKINNTYYPDELERPYLGPVYDYNRESNTQEALNISKQRIGPSYIERPKQKRQNFVYNVQSNISVDRSKNPISKQSSDAYKHLKTLGRKK